MSDKILNNRKQRVFDILNMDITKQYKNLYSIYKIARPEDIRDVDINDFEKGIEISVLAYGIRNFNNDLKNILDKKNEFLELFKNISDNKNIKEKDKKFLDTINFSIFNNLNYLSYNSKSIFVDSFEKADERSRNIFENVKNLNNSIKEIKSIEDKFKNVLNTVKNILNNEYIINLKNSVIDIKNKIELVKKYKIKFNNFEKLNDEINKFNLNYNIDKISESDLNSVKQFNLIFKSIESIENNILMLEVDILTNIKDTSKTTYDNYKKIRNNSIDILNYLYNRNKINNYSEVKNNIEDINEIKKSKYIGTFEEKVKSISQDIFNFETAKDNILKLIEKYKNLAIEELEENKNNFIAISNLLFNLNLIDYENSTKTIESIKNFNFKDFLKIELCENKLLYSVISIIKEKEDNLRQLYKDNKNLLKDKIFFEPFEKDNTNFVNIPDKLIFKDIKNTFDFINDYKVSMEELIKDFYDKNSNIIEKISLIKKNIESISDNIIKNDIIKQITTVEEQLIQNNFDEKNMNIHVNDLYNISINLNNIKNIEDKNVYELKKLKKLNYLNKDEKLIEYLKCFQSNSIVDLDNNKIDQLFSNDNRRIKIKNFEDLIFFMVKLEVYNNIKVDKLFPEFEKEKLVLREAISRFSQKFKIKDEKFFIGNNNKKTNLINDFVKLSLNSKDKVMQESILNIINNFENRFEKYNIRLTDQNYMNYGINTSIIFAALQKENFNFVNSLLKDRKSTEELFILNSADSNTFKQITKNKALSDNFIYDFLCSDVFENSRNLTIDGIERTSLSFLNQLIKQIKKAKAEIFISNQELNLEKGKDYEQKRNKIIEKKFTENNKELSDIFYSTLDKINDYIILNQDNKEKIKELNYFLNMPISGIGKLNDGSKIENEPNVTTLADILIETSLNNNMLNNNNEIVNTSLCLLSINKEVEMIRGLKIFNLNELKEKISNKNTNKEKYNFIFSDKNIKFSNNFKNFNCDYNINLDKDLVINKLNLKDLNKQKNCLLSLHKNRKTEKDLNIINSNINNINFENSLIMNNKSKPIKYLDKNINNIKFYENVDFINDSCFNNSKIEKYDGLSYEIINIKLTDKFTNIIKIVDDKKINNYYTFNSKKEMKNCKDFIKTIKKINITPKNKNIINNEKVIAIGNNVEKQIKKIINNENIKQI